MSKLLFSIFLDGIVKEINARVLGKNVVLKMSDMTKWELSQLLSAE